MVISVYGRRVSLLTADDLQTLHTTMTPSVSAFFTQRLETWSRREKMMIALYITGL